MGSPFQIALFFSEACSRHDSAVVLLEEFSKAIKKLGFDYYSCISHSEFPGSTESLPLITAPSDWLERYTEQGYERIDRIFQVAQSQRLPFEWSAEVVLRRASSGQRRVFREAKEFGLVTGVTVPIQMRGVLPASVSIAGLESRLDQESKAAVHLMAIYLYEALVRMKEQGQEIPMANAVGPLTKRQLECLKWAAAGKSDWEIGEILSISESTVHAHIESAKTRLDVRTRVQAVVRAFMGNYLPW